MKFTELDCVGGWSHAALGGAYPQRARRAGVKVDTLVVHFISAVNVDRYNPYGLSLISKIFIDFGVSAHFLIDREGNIYYMVDVNRVAFHAGGSIMPEPDNRKWVNEFSVGIECICAPDEEFTDLQYEALVQLYDDLCESRLDKENNVPDIFKTPPIVVGHDEISGQRAIDLGLRKDKKVDPGKCWDKKRFLSMVEKPIAKPIIIIKAETTSGSSAPPIENIRAFNAQDITGPVGKWPDTRPSVLTFIRSLFGKRKIK